MGPLTWDVYWDKVFYTGAVPRRSGKNKDREEKLRAYEAIELQRRISNTNNILKGHCGILKMVDIRHKVLDALKEELMV